METTEKERRVIASLPCMTLRGHVNDQIDFISPDSTKTYFSSPYSLLYNNGVFNEHTIYNVSLYLRHLYSVSGSEVMVPSEDGWVPLGDIPHIDTLPLHNASMINLKSLVQSHQDTESKHYYPLSYDEFIRNITKYATNGEVSGVEKETTETENDGIEKRALVCITGQLARVELENKLETLIKPIQSAGYRVDVALVLSAGNVWNKAPPSDFLPSFENEEQVLEYLKSKADLDVISENITYTPNQNIPVNPEFVFLKARDSLFRKPKQPYTSRDRGSIHHVLFKMVKANHLMLESYSRCWKDAVKSKRNYSLFVRAREDIGFLDKISTSVFEPMAPHSIVTSSCRVNSGINDRFAFISPDSAECYFNTPFVRYYDGDHLGFGIFNTEAMFKRVYLENNCTKPQASREIVPLKMMSGSFLQFDKDDPKCP
mmetsp:Transcript_1005/g.2329  ORF Transcript_1005/g.2329 Transcript_1005/m.2329 type:complete len:429 (-) Transcript_1005:631-1917(-)